MSEQATLLEYWRSGLHAAGKLQLPCDYPRIGSGKVGETLLNDCFVPVKLSLTDVSSPSLKRSLILAMTYPWLY